MLQAKYAEAAAKHAEEVEKREQEAKEKFEAGEISEAEYKTLLSAQTKHADEPFSSLPIGQSGGKPEATGFNGPEYMQEEDLIDTAADLTTEDKLYLAMKWGRLYKPQE